MRLTIERMHLENFKGVRCKDIIFGDKTSIAGMNGTGKTTIPDAFCWVLYNKDSHGNAPGSDNFREKPLDDSGKEIHYLDTTVELICRLDGQPFNLRRTQRENWVKKRGSVEATYQGNVSTYWINDVETKQVDFKARIAQITNEEVFRLIGSLSAFNALEWKKRRAQLLALSGIDVDATLLQRDEYRMLADECAQRGVQVEDLRKIMADQRKRTNTELSMIPVRIDEARKAMSVVSDREIVDAEFIVADSLNSLAAVDNMLIEAKADSSGEMQRITLLRMSSELSNLEHDVAYKHQQAIMKLKNEMDDAMSTAYRIRSDHKSEERRLAELKEMHRVETANRDELRKKYNAAYERKFEAPVGQDVCPACGQTLPPDKVAAALEAAKADFDHERRSELAKIKTLGSQASARISDLEKRIEEVAEKVERLSKDVESVDNTYNAYRAEYEAAASKPVDYTLNPRIIELRAEIEAAKAQQVAPEDSKVKQLEERKAELTAIIDRNRAILARRDQAKELEARIAQLEQQQHDAGARIGDIEQIIALVEKFIQDRCSVLEGSINSQFPTLRWKLFDIQINGGITDTCVCMIPCESGLVSYESANTAAQVHADLEIVDVLSKHYDVSVPVFIDNAERCNTLPALSSQTITLSVSTDSELTVYTA